MHHLEMIPIQIQSLGIPAKQFVHNHVCLQVSLPTTPKLLLTSTLGTSGFCGRSGSSTDTALWIYIPSLKNKYHYNKQCYYHASNVTCIQWKSTAESITSLAWMSANHSIELTGTFHMLNGMTKKCMGTLYIYMIVCYAKLKQPYQCNLYTLLSL